MNTISAKELKRRGAAALEESLKKGPVHILKNNRPVCVVLTEEDYRTMATGEGRARTTFETRSAIFRLLDRPSAGTRSREEIDEQLKAERESWGGR